MTWKKRAMATRVKKNFYPNSYCCNCTYTVTFKRAEAKLATRSDKAISDEAMQ
jgi:hypothetical protein